MIDKYNAYELMNLLIFFENGYEVAVNSVFRRNKYLNTYLII